MPFVPNDAFVHVESPSASLQAKIMSCSMSLNSKVAGGRAGSVPSAGIHTGPSRNWNPSASTSTVAGSVPSPAASRAASSAAPGDVAGSWA